MHRYTDIDTDTIGNQPDAPDDDAEAAEAAARLFRSPEIGCNGPKCVNQHQHNGNNSRDGVNAVVGMCQMCDMLHQSCPYDVAYNA